MSDVLVLDCGYQAISRVPWETAIVWTLERVVDVVDEYPTRSINTVNWSVKMPSIVRFVKPIHKKKAVKFSRHNVFARDKGRCQYCSIVCTKGDWEYEHVVPRCQGGKTTWENIVVSCTSCNQRKANKTPEQAGMMLRTRPARPKTLPNVNTFSMTYKPGMPESWRDFLRSAVYWDGALNEE